MIIIIYSTALTVKSEPSSQESATEALLDFASVTDFEVWLP